MQQAASLLKAHKSIQAGLGGLGSVGYLKSTSSPSSPFFFFFFFFLLLFLFHTLRLLPLIFHYGDGYLPSRAYQSSLLPGAGVMNAFWM